MRRYKHFIFLVVVAAILLSIGAAPALAKDFSPQFSTDKADVSEQSFDWLIHIGYLSVLDRIDTPAEYVAWWDALQGGTVSRAGFANALVESHERSMLIANWAYNTSLGRDATFAEANAWANAMDAGMTWRQAAAMIGASQECADYFGVTNDSQFVDAAYNVLLNRSPDPAEVTPWTNAMAAGLSRYAVLWQIAASKEYTYSYVRFQYDWFLNRDAAPGEVAMWGDALSAGTILEETVVAGLIGSDEFFWFMLILL